MKIIHQNGYSKDELLMFRLIVCVRLSTRDFPSPPAEGFHAPELGTARASKRLGGEPEQLGRAAVRSVSPCLA